MRVVSCEIGAVSIGFFENIKNFGEQMYFREIILKKPYEFIILEDLRVCVSNIRSFRDQKHLNGNLLGQMFNSTYLGESN